MTELHGRAAVVAGGAGVIGEALARELVGAGALVTLADIAVDKGQALAAELDCAFIDVDVTDPSANHRMIAAAVGQHGRLDLVFLNAGVSTQDLKARLPYDLAAIDLNTYRKILAVNIDGPVFGVAAAIPALVESGGGAIVITSSVAGLIP